MATSTLSIEVVDFHGEPIVALRRDGAVFAAVKPFCDHLGIAWPRQYARLSKDPVLAPAITLVVTALSDHGQAMVCLPLEMIHGWLFKINADRVRPEAREKLIRYQRECYAVLFAHFHGKATRKTQADEARKLRLVAETRLTFGVRAAQRAWIGLGLPTNPAMFEPARQSELFPGPAETIQ